MISVFQVLRVSACLICLASPLTAAENPRVNFAFGVLAECRGEAEPAAAHFENARLADPSATALVERGVARRLAAGDRAGAITLFREFAAAKPDCLAVQLAYADFLTAQGKGDSLAGKLATETLGTALAKNPGHPEVIRRLVSLDRAGAEELIGQLSEDDPDSARLFASLSRSLHEPDDAAALAETDRRLMLAFDAHPDDPGLAREISEHFRNTMRTDEAIAVLKRHAGAAPWSLDLRVRIGVLCFTAKRDAEGEAALKEVLAIHPRHALAHQALAKSYRWRGNPERASFHAGELLKIRGGSPAEFIKLADEHLTAGQPREARLLLEKAVFDHPDHLELRMKLAVASRRDPETRAHSARWFREAEMLAPDGKITDPAFLSESAEALIDSGQSHAAEERLRAAIRAYPPDAKQETAATLRRLAALWNAENRNAEAARALLQRAAALDP